MEEIIVVAKMKQLIYFLLFVFMFSFVSAVTIESGTLFEPSNGGSFYVISDFEANEVIVNANGTIINSSDNIGIRNDGTEGNLTVICPLDSATYTIKPNEEWSVDCGSNGESLPTLSNNITQNINPYAGHYYGIGFFDITTSIYDFYNLNQSLNFTENRTSSTSHTINLSNNGVVTLNGDFRKDLKVTNNSINLTTPSEPNNYFRNESTPILTEITTVTYSFDVASNIEYEVGAIVYETTLYEGWNILPQTWSVGRNLSTISNLTTATLVSYYNTTNRSFISYVDGIDTNAGYNVTYGESYFAYVSEDTNYNITEVANTNAYNFSSTGWYLQYAKDESGLLFGTVNSTLNSGDINVTAMSYFNSSSGVYTPAIYAFNISYDFTIPYLNSYWMYVNKTFEATR